MHQNGLKTLTVSAMIALASLPTHAEPEILLDRLELAPGVVYYRPESPIGNQTSLVVAGTDALLLVDANIDVIIPLILDDIARSFDVELQYVATTHHHADHTQGLESLPPKLVRVAPATQRELLKTKPLTTDDSPPLRAQALPTLTFSDALTLHLGGVTVEIRTPPARNAHTGGDAFVYVPEHEVLYVGDHYFYGKFPLIDFDGGGSLDGYLENLAWIEKTFPPGTRVLPGHGAFHPAAPVVPTMQEFSAWRSKIVEAIDTLRDAVRRGAALDEVVAKGLGAEFASMGERPRYTSEERWIRMLWPALVEERRPR